MCTQEKQASKPEQELAFRGVNVMKIKIFICLFCSVAFFMMSVLQFGETAIDAQAEVVTVKKNHPQALLREHVSGFQLPIENTEKHPAQSIVVAAISCKVCGGQSRSCHAPCKRMTSGKGACHNRCRSRLAVCKKSCTRGPGPSVPITIDLSGKAKTKTVSAKEAKKIALSKRTSVVAAIPPNIDDITAILRAQKPDAAKIAKLTKLADQKPPATKSSSKLSKFFHDRGIAAGDIGRSEQELSDFQQAAKYAEASRNAQLKYFAYGRLSTAAGGAGLFREAVAFREKTIQNSTHATQKIRNTAILATSHATLGDLSKAEKTMVQVQKLLRAGVPKKTWQKWQYDILRSVKYAQATILSSKGEHEKATTLYKSALADYERYLKRPKNDLSAAYADVVKQVLRRRLAISLENEGKIVEAEVVMREALLERLKATGLYSTWAPRIVLRFADHLALQGRIDESRELVNVAINVMQTLGFPEASYRLFSAQMLLARLEFLSGQTDKALAIYGNVEKSLDKSSDYTRRLVENDKDRLLALAIGGRHGDVVEYHARKAASPEATLLSGAYGNGALAIALAKAGETKKSYKTFRKLIPRLTEKSGAQADEDYTLGTASELRNSIIYDEYLTLLAGIHDTPAEAALDVDASAEAFAVADIARGQLVQKAVSAASARISVDDAKLAELIRTEQDTRKQLTAQSGLLAGILSTPTNQQDPKALKELEGNIAVLQKALDRLLADIKKGYPDYAALLAPRTPDVGELRKALQKEEAYISIYLGRNQSYVWALPKDGPLAFNVSTLTADRAGKFVNALRDALNPNAATLGDIPDFDVRVAYKLYQELLQPVEAGWRQAKSLIVSTNGALGQLPLSVLPTELGNIKNEDGPLFHGYRDVKWLARTHAITLLPSATTLVTLRELPEGKQDRKPFIGFGNPYFNEDQAKKPVKVAAAPADAVASRGVLRTRGMPIRLRAAPRSSGDEKPDLSKLPALPDTGDEVRGIALAMAADVSTAVQLGKKANEETIRKSDLSSYKVIAFATHGLIPGDLSGLREPALALTAPDVAKSEGDGLLTMSEIMSLKLDADWVVLSACNTGTARGAGAEAVSGLGRAFFYAGTRALLVSSWPVETVSARLLTTDVFRRMTSDAKISRAQALQQAVSALIDRPAQTDPETGKPVFYYAHPIFWAPFILVGDGGKISSAT